jgi:hypothetical protein
MKTTLCLMALVLAASLAHAGETPASSKLSKNVMPCLADDCSSRLDYNFVESGFIQFRYDNKALDPSNGGYVEFSHEFAKNLFVDGSFTFLEDSFNTQEYGLGLGGYFPLTKKIHLVGRVGYSYLDTPGAGYNQVYVSPGFRALLCCHAELYAKLYYTHNRDSDDISGGGGILWHVTKNIGINTGAAWGKDGWSWQAGVRYQW